MEFGGFQIPWSRLRLLKTHGLGGRLLEAGSEPNRLLQQPIFVSPTEEGPDALDFVSQSDQAEHLGQGHSEKCEIVRPKISDGPRLAEGGRDLFAGCVKFCKGARLDFPSVTQTFLLSQERVDDPFHGDDILIALFPWLASNKEVVFDAKVFFERPLWIAPRSKEMKLAADLLGSPLGRVWE